MKYRQLFSPGRVGNLELPNRVVMAVVTLNWAENSCVTPELIAYYQARARGGVGLILAGAAFLDEAEGRGNPDMLGIGDDKYLPGLKRLTEAVHEAGGKIGLHFFHPGKFALESNLRGLQPISSTAIPSRMTRNVPRELTAEEIQNVEDKFAEDALRASQAGFDAIELNVCSGYLVREFLSPLTNKRTDAYGGTIANRARFLLEILEKIRKAAGQELAVICKISADEFLQGGNTLQEMRELAPLLAANGVDALDVTVGGHETSIPMMPGHVPQGAFVYFAEQIKKVVDIPVIAGVRIHDPALAELILVEGRADLVAIGRPLHTDPDFLAKLARDESEEIMPCISCNQGCFDNTFGSGSVTCHVNPLVRKDGFPALRPAAPRKKVLVVGGGPAGLKSAQIARERGHEVTLVEKRTELGGQLRLACMVPGKIEFGQLIQYLATQLSRKGVKVELGVKATSDFIQEMAPEVVVMATGSLGLQPPLTGLGEIEVFEARQVLEENQPVGRRVVIIGGGAVGCDLALLLTRQSSIAMEALVFLSEYGKIDSKDFSALSRGNREITILEQLPRLGGGIGRSVRWSLLGELGQRGVAMLAQSRVTRVNVEGVFYEQGGEEKLAPADTVILACGAVPDVELEQDLQNLGLEYHKVGDAQEVGNSMTAVKEALELGSKI